MPLLEVTQIRHVSASVRLNVTTAAQVDQYAAFIEASGDDVIEQALTFVFSKDREFQEFLKSPQAASVTPTLRVRRTPGNDASEPTAIKPVNGAKSVVQPQPIAAGVRT